MQAEIWHYGIKGQQRGVRRFQNEDGSYTDEGKRRYGIGEKQFVSTQEQKMPPGTRSGPYGTFQYKDPNQRIRETSKKIKTVIKEGRDLKNTIVTEKQKKSKVQTMLDIGKETKKDREDKKLLKEQLKAGYKHRLGGALSTAVLGWNLKTLGSLVGMTGHKAAAGVLSGAGKVLIGGGAFKAVASTGAYFIGKNMIDENKIRV